LTPFHYDMTFVARASIQEFPRIGSGRAIGSFDSRRRHIVGGGGRSHAATDDLVETHNVLQGTQLRWTAGLILVCIYTTIRVISALTRC
jgi:hypothetical protein